MITKLPITWKNQPEEFSLKENQIQIYCIEFNVLKPYLQQMTNLLFPVELIRADQFVFTRDRERFILARGFLRLLLGKFLARSGAQIELAYTPHGKPYINNEYYSGDLQFNISHAGDLLMIAIQKGHTVGIDVEFMRPSTDVLSLAKNYFSPLEFQTMQKLSTHGQIELFFQLWTRKEAVLKNSGKGLSYSLADAEVLANNMVVTDMGIYFVASLPMEDNYQAAISSSNAFEVEHIQCWRIDKLIL